MSILRTLHYMIHRKGYSMGLGVQATQIHPIENAVIDKCPGSNGLIRCFGSKLQGQNPCSYRQDTLEPSLIKFPIFRKRVYSQDTKATPRPLEAIMSRTEGTTTECEQLPGHHGQMTTTCMLDTSLAQGHASKRISTCGVGT